MSLEEEQTQPEDDLSEGQSLWVFEIARYEVQDDATNSVPSL